MPRVLVTAASGNVGREVARECSEQGFSVRVAGRDLVELAQRFPRAEAAALDFFDPSTWGPALEGCQFVFLVRPPAVGDVGSTLNPFIDRAYATGVEHIVFLSVSGADTMKWTPHRKVELHLETSGKRWTLLRVGFFAQNLQDAYRRDIVEDGRLYVPAGGGSVAFVDVSDVAAVAARVFREPVRFAAKALTLTGPVAMTFSDVASTLTRVLGKPVRYQPASALGYALHLKRARGLPWMQVIVQTILHLGLRKGNAALVDPTLAKLLERAPHTMERYVTCAAATWSS